MKTALITGISGQDGAFLAQLLLENGYKVIGGMRRSASGSLWRLDYLNIRHLVEIVDFDLLDQENVRAVIRKYKPTELYNLAAMSFVGTSFDQPVNTFNINATGVLYILEAVKHYSPDTKVYQASTSEMFGGMNSLQDENTPFHPRSPYGVAKLAAHQLVINYRESYGLFACAGILFNHESELRGSEFVTKKIVEHVAKRAKDITMPPLELGNMYSKRDWGYSKDYVVAMYEMLQQSVPNDFVIATNETHTVKEFVTAAFEAVGINIGWHGEGEDEIGYDLDLSTIDEAVALVVINPKFYRPAEVNILQGDYGKAEKILGWKPTTNFGKLVKIMINAEVLRLS